MKAIEQKTLKFIQENNLIQNKDNILVAFSGGADSVFLLSFLHKFSELLKIKIFAAHINHNLRGKEAVADQEFCTSFCKKRNINFYAESVDVKNFAASNKISVEEAARELRYNVLSKIAGEQDCNKIATAHNIGDNSETMLFNFLKGCGIAGLKGIPVQRNNIIRPILPVYKSEIISWLNDEKTDFVIDSSNLENDYKRNYIRNEIIPLVKENLNPSFESALLNAGSIFSSAEKIIHKHLEPFIKQFVKLNQESIEIKTDFFTEENDYLFGELIKRVVKQGLNRDITFSDYKTIVSLASNHKGTKNYLSKNLIAVREKDTLVISGNKEENEIVSVKTDYDKSCEIGDLVISFEKVTDNERPEFSSKYEMIDFDKLKGNSVIRVWNDGDKFRPLGMDGFKKVADFLSEQNIRSQSKRNQLVLENDGNIVWVVGLRVDDRYKITNETKNILKVRIT